MVAPGEACENLERLAAEGREGAYGFYEAVDYTPSRLPPGQSSVTIRSFMAHHQGMSLLALAYLLLGQPMQRRFLCLPRAPRRALLLQERVPQTTAKVFSEDSCCRIAQRPTAEGRSHARVAKPYPSLARSPSALQWPLPCLVSNAGGGYSRWRDLALTRWREDATRDCWGTFIYLRDVATREFWSATHQPTLRPTKRDETIFTQARAEFRQQPWRIWKSIRKSASRPKTTSSCAA